MRTLPTRPLMRGGFLSGPQLGRIVRCCPDGRGNMPCYDEAGNVVYMSTSGVSVGDCGPAPVPSPPAALPGAPAAAGPSSPPPAVPPCCQTYWEPGGRVWYMRCHGVVGGVVQDYEGPANPGTMAAFSNCAPGAVPAAAPAAAPPTVPPAAVPAPAPVTVPPQAGQVPAPVPVTVSPPPPGVPPAAVTAGPPSPVTFPLQNLTFPGGMQEPPLQKFIQLAPGARGGYVPQAPPPYGPVPSYPPGAPIPVSDWFGICRRRSGR